MKTEVIMKRELFGSEISQKSKSELFSATDLIKAGNSWRIGKKLQPINFNKWYNRKDIQEFVKQLEKKYGTVKIEARGRGHHTWVHPLIFIDLALAISPELKIEVYEWLFDHLLKYRVDSGNSYKKMVGALYSNHSNKSTFTDFIKDVCYKIQYICEIEDWQKANESQLKLRDDIHNNISLLCNVLRDNEQAVRIGIIETLKNTIKING